MAAAAHRFPAGVEDEGSDIAKAIGGHGFGQAALEALDREGGGDLADEAASVGKAGLDGDPAASAGIIAVGFLGQQGIKEAAAVFEGAFRFEQGRDIDLVGNAEQLGEIERGQDRGRLLAFGDQHADRAVGIHVGEDLRHGEKLADRRGILDRQRGEIGAQGPGFCQKLAHAHEGGLAGKVEPAIGVDPAADGILQLRGVYPEMDPAHAEAIGTHGRGGDQQGAGDIVVGMAGLGFELADDCREAGELVGVIGGEGVGGGGERGGIGKIGGEQLGHLGGAGRGAGEAGGQIRRGLGERSGIGREPLGFFGEAIADRGVPADIGAPIHVVADPGGEAERGRANFAPAPGPAAARLVEDLADDPVTRGLGVDQRLHRLVVLIVEADGIARRRGDADRGGIDGIGRGGGDHGLALGAGEQEGGVGGEDHVDERTLPAGGEFGEVGPRREAGDGRGVGLGRDRAEHPHQPSAARLEAFAFELGNEAVERGEGQAAVFEAARQLVAELEHRIEQRGLDRKRMELLEALLERGDGKVVRSEHGRWS